MTDGCEPPVTEASNRSTWYTENVRLCHLRYSPDLAPSDFHLFGPLNDAIRGTNLETADPPSEILAT
jgi:hypothetical protein